MGVSIHIRDRLVERRTLPRFRQRESRLPGHHRAVQQTAAPRQFRGNDHRPGAVGRERQDRLRHLCRQRPRRPLRPGGLYEQPGPLRVVPRQQQSDEVSGQRQVGRCLVGALGPNYQVAWACDRRRGRVPGQRRRRGLRDRVLLQPLRHRRPMVHRRSRIGDQSGLFRTSPQRRHAGRTGGPLPGAERPLPRPW